MPAIKCKKTKIAVAVSVIDGECLCKSTAECLVFPDEAAVQEEKGNAVGHVAGATIRPGIPERQPEKCPTCGGTDFGQGYGMAGGGMGVYSYCTNCGKVTSKVETE